MSAPIPTPTRSRINLHRLLARKPDAIEVQAALEAKFPKVFAEFTDDPAFPFVIRCLDADLKPRLAIFFRWSMARDQWLFKVMAGQ